MTILRSYQATFHTHADTLRPLGYCSLLDIATEDFATFSRTCQGELSWKLRRKLHRTALAYAAEVQAYQRQIQSHANPQLQSIRHLNLPDQQQALRDYTSAFGQRADSYVPTNAVSSMFSPSAYLTELYRESRGLHHEGAPRSLDRRRPDLEKLLLSQENQDATLSTLRLANEILDAQLKLMNNDWDQMSFFADGTYPFALPYHIPFASIEMVLDAHKTEVMTLWRGLGVDPVAGTQQLFGNHLPPKLQELLTESSPDTEAELTTMLEAHFGKDVDTTRLNEADYLCQRTGITQDELSLYATGVYVNIEFTFYEPGSANTVIHGSESSTAGNNIVQKVKYDVSSQYSYFRIRSGRGNDKFGLDGRLESIVMSHDKINVIHLSQLIRYGQHTGLSPAALDTLILLSSVNPDTPAITTATLTLTAQALQYQKDYLLGEDDAVLLAGGDISTVARPGELSQFDCLFNNPPLNGILFESSENPDSLDFDGTDPDSIHHRAVLQRALGVDDAGLQTLVGICTPSVRSWPRNLRNLSMLVRVGQWARLHALSPTELECLLLRTGQSQDLLPELDTGTAVAYPVLQDCLEEVRATQAWLHAQKLTPLALKWMTTTDYSGELTPEIDSFLQTLYNAGCDKLQGTPTEQQIIDTLAPDIAAGLGLSSAEVAVGIQQWYYKLDSVPAISTALAFWTALAEEYAPPVGSITTPVGSINSANLPAFSHALAQLALIARTWQLTAADLRLIVDFPSRLDSAIPQTGKVDLTLVNLQGIAQLKNLQTAVGVNVSELMTALRALDNGVTPATLADWLQQPDAEVLAAANCAAAGESIMATSPLTARQAADTDLWLQTSRDLGVATSVAGQLLKDDWVSATMDQWAALCDNLLSGVPESQALAIVGQQDESLSTALCAYALTQDTYIHAGLTNRDEIFQYLLIDNQVSAQVQTSRIAEAMASVQLYINRCLQGLEGNCWTDADWKTQPFFAEWERYNRRYSTWAGVSQLVYYPENYVEPTLRYNQSLLQEQLLTEVSQNQLTVDSVQTAYLNYLDKFEEVSNLKVISGYNTHVNIEQGKSYFVGRTTVAPYDYFWRSLNQQDVTIEGVYPASAWSDWRKIELPVAAMNDEVRLCEHNGRLHLAWVEKREVVVEDAEDIKEYYMHLAQLKLNGMWQLDVSRLLSTPVEADDRLYFSHDNTSGNTLLFTYTYVEGTLKDPWQGWVIDRNKEFIDVNDETDGTTYKTYYHPIINYNMQAGYAIKAVPGLLAEEVAFNENNGGHTSGCTMTSAFRVADVVAADGLSQLRMSGAVATTMDVVKDFGWENADFTVTGTGFFIFNIYDVLFASCNSRLHVACECKFTVTDNYNLIVLSFNGPGFSYAMGSISLDSGTIEPYGPAADVLKSVIGITGVAHADVVTGNGLHVVTARLPIPAEKDSCLEMGCFQQGFTDQFYYHIAPTNPVDAAAFNSYPDAGIGDMTLEIVKANRLVRSVPLGPVLSGDKVYPYAVQEACKDEDEYRVNIRMDVFGVPLTMDVAYAVYDDAVPDNLAICTVPETAVQYLEPLKSPGRLTRTRLNTLFANMLVRQASLGLEQLLRLDVQMDSTLEPAPGSGGYLSLIFESDDLPRTYQVILNKNNTKYVIGTGGTVVGVSHERTFFIPDSGKGTDNVLMVTVEYSGGSEIVSYLKYTLQENGNGLNDQRYLADNLATCPALGLISATPLSSYIQSEAMDFNGANGLYFWELYYYTPTLITQRLLQEGNFEAAEQWIRYIFNPQDPSEPWRCRPLKDDITWNPDPLSTTYDPDIVALADPMHYKVATYMQLLDLLIARGDAAYRLLERDTLAEAKMWYVTALNLLGEEPDIPLGGDWSEPTLAESADATAPDVSLLQLARLVGDAMREWSRADETVRAEPADALRGGGSPSLFLPPLNDKLQGYWRTLESRLFNLRQNLSIDGQPLNLPLFAPPANPKALQTAAAAGSSGGTALPDIPLPLLRFPFMLDSARGLVSQLTQYGSTLLSVFERKDGETMQMLLQTQAKDLMLRSIMMQDTAIEQLEAELATLDAALEGAQARLNSYQTLLANGISETEQQVMNLLRASGTCNTTSSSFTMIASAMNMVPNIFGLAAGGCEWGAATQATAVGFSVYGEVMQITANQMATSEQYRRRAEEWQIQRDAAEHEVKQLQAQQAAFKIQQQAAQQQKDYLLLQQEQTEVQLTFLKTKFSNEALYSWMQGRLSSMFYQFYDLTVGRCLRAQLAYQWETNMPTTFIQAGAWNGNQAGLLCGEALMLNLARMESAYQEWDARALEVVRTVSMAQAMDTFTDQSCDTYPDFNAAVQAVLGDKDLVVSGTDGHTLELNFLAQTDFVATIDLALLAIDEDYPVSFGGQRRLKQVSVSLPALLGPYQDVRAVLYYASASLHTSCQQVAISHGLNDSGLFQLDFNDGKYLPFEGLPVADGTLTLSFPGADDHQAEMLQSLNDIILHLRYTIRD